MNRKEINLSEMFLTVEEYLTENMSSVSHISAIMLRYNELKSANTTIATLKNEQSVDTSVDYKMKSDDKNLLIANAVKISDGLQVIAVTNNDSRLKIESTETAWNLRRIRESDMLVRLHQICVLAFEHKDQLMALDITEEDIELLNENASEFMKASPVINNKKGKATQATNKIGNIVQETNAMLREKLDVLMLQFKLTNEKLYGGYLNARKVNDRAAGRSTKKPDAEKE